MSRYRYRLQTAAGEYQCTERSYHVIRPGDLYLYGACPPWHEANQSRKWWVIKACLRCAREFGLHNSDTRVQLAWHLDRQGTFTDGAGI